MIDYDKFKKALKHLELQNNNLQTLEDSLPELLKEAVAESVIQRFETCYDCLWKVLKRYLDEELGLPELRNSPKPLLRIAAENALFRVPIEDWLAYADARTATAHDYSEEKLQAVLALMPAFIEDAIGLYQTLIFIFGTSCRGVSNRISSTPMLWCRRGPNHVLKKF